MEVISLGWCPDVSDARDYVISQETRSPLPMQLDLREPELALEYDPSISNHASVCISLLGLIKWQSRKWTGDRVHGSPEFLHQLILRLACREGRSGIGIRTAIKTLKQFGAPPRHLCARDRGLSILDQPELYRFARPFEGLQYFRLDHWTCHWQDHLATMKAWLVRGNPFVIGFAVPINLPQQSGLIPFDLRRGATLGGTACVVMGYDDHYESFVTPAELASTGAKDERELLLNRGTRGALLAKTCLRFAGSKDGYVWLPYEFVQSRFARDAWAISDPEWSC